MKKFSLLFVILLLVMPLFSGDGIYEYEALSFDHATSVVSTDTDTSDVFTIYRTQAIQGPRKMTAGMVYPTKLSFLLYAVENSNSDSSKVYFYLDLSNDQTYWYANGIIDSVVSVSGTATTTVEAASVISFPYFKYGRIRTLAAMGSDTCSIGVQVNRYFP